MKTIMCCLILQNEDEKVKLNHIVTNVSTGRTVKSILKNELQISNNLIKRLKYSKKIFLNSIPVHINKQIVEGDVIDVYVDFQEERDQMIPQKIDLDIIYEDDCLIVLNKQPFIVVHPTFNHPNSTIANALSYYYKSKGIEKIIRPVSRLDKDTSGIIVLAKNEFVQDALIKQMHSKVFKKEYIGVVSGIIKNNSGIIDLPIGRKPGSIIMRQICQDGSASITKYEVVKHLINSTVLKFDLETGRTHQIRVHCLAIGHPLLGETLYCDSSIISFYNIAQEKLDNELNSISLLKHINRQALHSHRITFIHPFTREYMELTAPIPQDILHLFDVLELDV